MESLIIGYYSVTACGDSLYDSVILYIVDEYPLTYNLVDTIISVCPNLQDQVEVTDFANSISPYQVQWDFGSSTNPTNLPLLPSENDTVIQYVTITDGCGDTWVDSVVHFANPQVLQYNLDDTITSLCMSDSNYVEITNFSGAPAPYSVQWSFGGTNNPTLIPVEHLNNQSTLYHVTITDGCGRQYTDSFTYLTAQTLSIDTILSTPANCNPIGTVSTMSFPYGAQLQNPNNPTSFDLNFDWTYGNDTTITFPNQSALTDLPGGWYYIELTDNVIDCKVNDSVFVNVVDVPTAVLNADPGSGCSPLVTTLSNESQNSNQYFWDLGDGNPFSTNDLNPVNHTFETTTIVQLVASNGDVTCNDTTTITVSIVECGCMDPMATNYNPNAVIDDGSCVFPTPTVIAPNVVTFNGDNVNDLFFLQTEYAASIELTILNRWGEVVFTGNGTQTSPPMWNGRNKKGVEVSDGVYFYKYKVVGQLGDELEGHGFMTVVR